MYRMNFMTSFIKQSTLNFRPKSTSVGSVKTQLGSGKSLVGTRTALSLTPSALKRVKYLLNETPDAKGLRVGVKTRGCNGLTYTLDFSLDGEKAGDEVVKIDQIKIFIDRRAQLTLLGTEMDYQEGIIASEFVFNNPNVKGTCGCGESFTV